MFGANLLGKLDINAALLVIQQQCQINEVLYPLHLSNLNSHNHMRFWKAYDHVNRTVIPLSIPGDNLKIIDEVEQEQEQKHDKLYTVRDC